jgi:hypothetical protein
MQASKSIGRRRSRIPVSGAKRLDEGRNGVWSAYRTEQHEVPDLAFDRRLPFCMPEIRKSGGG